MMNGRSSRTSQALSPKMTKGARGLNKPLKVMMVVIPRRRRAKAKERERSEEGVNDQTSHIIEVSQRNIKGNGKTIVYSKGAFSLNLE